MANGKDGHDKAIEAALEKARGLGKTEGYEYVVRTVTKLSESGIGVEDDPSRAKAEDQIIQIGVFKTEPAKVVVQKGLTMNLGNYESARVTVGFECPCYVEEVGEVTDALNAAVEARVQKEVLEVRGKDIRPGYEAKRTA